MIVNREREGIRIISEYWETFHSKESGAISEIRFKYGSGKNIIVSPLNSYIRRKEGKNYPYYEEICCENSKVVLEEGNNLIKIIGQGNYISKDKKSIPVKYKRVFTYQNFGLIKVDLEIDFLKEIDCVIEIGIAGISFIEDLKTVGWRPNPEVDPSPSFPGRCLWHEFKSENHYNSCIAFGRYLPLYLCLINRRREGIEIFQGDDIENNSSKIFIDETGHSYSEVSYQENSIKLRYEPYGNWQIPIKIKPGKYKFSYYIGLPFSKGEDRIFEPYFHVAINSNWPDEKKLDLWAKSGIKLIRLHNDYREDGPFWRDGYYPPYDEENMKKMDWVIKQCHKRNMKIIPYFSLKELHPDCPEYKKYADEWKRTIDKNLSILHNWAGSGEFGAQMCLRSKWLEFRKKSIELVLKNHDFDGVYYDWVTGLFCNNPLHLKGKRHTDVEELLDIIFWTRKLVGPDKIIFVHLSGCHKDVIRWL